MVRLLVTQDKFVREATAASRRSEFDIAMTKLYAINPAAALYLKAIPLHKWTLHALRRNSSLRMANDQHC